MKMNLKSAALFTALFFATAVNAQDNGTRLQTPPSDVSSGYTYDFDKTQSLILSRITNPDKSNSIVQVFLDQKDFPALASGKKIDSNYKDELRKWMEKNPDLILNTLKSRTDIVTKY